MPPAEAMAVGTLCMPCAAVPSPSPVLRIGSVSFLDGVGLGVGLEVEVGVGVGVTLPVKKGVMEIVEVCDGVPVSEGVGVGEEEGV
jgi:hypothetical protein